VSQLEVDKGAIVFLCSEAKEKTAKIQFRDSDWAEIRSGGEGKACLLTLVQLVVLRCRECNHDVILNQFKMFGLEMTKAVESAKSVILYHGAEGSPHLYGVC